MLYIISIEETRSSNNSYTIFETSTDSSFIGDLEFLKKLTFEYKLDTANVCLDNNEIALKQWFNKVHYEKYSNDRWERHKQISTGADYVLLCKTACDTFKLVAYNGEVGYASSESLKISLEENQVANCKIVNGNYEYIDNYNADADSQFVREIAEKYERHIALTNMLGRNMTFEYIIEAKEVKLKRYTGETKDVIVPNFITSIMIKAFDGTKIETITFGNRLTSIGRQAFRLCNLSEVIIPESVQLICPDAFELNKRLTHMSGGYKKTIKIMNAGTIIINKVDNNACDPYLD